MSDLTNIQKELDEAFAIVLAPSKERYAINVSSLASLYCVVFSFKYW
jgi:hypothetical protein